MVWLTGGALLLCLLMIVGLLVLVTYYGLSTFWPLEVVKIATLDGGVYAGETTRGEWFKLSPEALELLPEEARGRARAEMAAKDGWVHRRLVSTGNYKETMEDFQWVNDFLVKEEIAPADAVVIERLEWGRFYGVPEAFLLVADPIGGADGSGASKSIDEKKEEARRLLSSFAPGHGGEPCVLGQVTRDDQKWLDVLPPDRLDSAIDVLGVGEVVRGSDRAWAIFEEHHGGVRKRWRARRAIEKYDTGALNQEEEEARLGVREAELEAEDAEAAHGLSSQEHADAVAALETARERYKQTREWAEGEFARIRAEIAGINEENGRYLVLLSTFGQGVKPPEQVLMRLDAIVRAYRPNRLSLAEKVGVYLSRWWEYLTEEPREANMEGGVFPAIFGTVVMTLLMALAVVPFGVLASLYLREYARAGPVVSSVRIAVNNLAGVPSIVYGVFGLGFFCYGVGGFIDGGPTWHMPKPAWFLLLGAMCLVAIVAFIAFMLSIVRPGERVVIRQRVFRYISITLWIAASLAIVALIATTPFYHGFYRARLPNPTFGKGALIWASFTLAIMTLPVVIVATEEALAAVPNSMREGSYACGAGKWQTIRRIVLPRALPGIMTGMILAMARGAGEVAPLMLVGAVKVAPELPFEWTPPFGINRSFMHLGFHIFDLGFHSRNSEAAKPMVYTTTLLLIVLIAALNIAAIALRSRLRRRFVSDRF